MRSIPSTPAILFIEPENHEFKIGDVTSLPTAGETCAFSLKSYSYVGLVSHAEVIDGVAKIWASDLKLAGNRMQ